MSKTSQHETGEVGTGGGPGLIRLGALGSGEIGTLHDVLAGRGLLSRLSALGFTPGVELTMVQNFGTGPVIVSVRGTRIALGRGEADKIRVSRSGGEQ